MLLSGFVIIDKRRTQNTYTHILQDKNSQKSNENRRRSEKRLEKFFDRLKNIRNSNKIFHKLILSPKNHGKLLLTVRIFRPKYSSASRKTFSLVNCPLKLLLNSFLKRGKSKETNGKFSFSRKNL